MTNLTSFSQKTIELEYFLDPNQPKFLLFGPYFGHGPPMVTIHDWPPPYATPTTRPRALTQLGLRGPHDLAGLLPDGLTVLLQLVEPFSPPRAGLDLQELTAFQKGLEVLVILQPWESQYW